MERAELTDLLCRLLDETGCHPFAAVIFGYRRIKKKSTRYLDNGFHIPAEPTRELTKKVCKVEHDVDLLLIENAWCNIGKKIAVGRALDSKEMARPFRIGMGILAQDKIDEIDALQNSNVAEMTTQDPDDNPVSRLIQFRPEGDILTEGGLA